MNLVVTGSSSGIGRALALRLVGRGHSVWGLARREQPAPEGKQKGQFRSSRCDVAQWAEIERVASEVAGFWQHADGLVTCAGLQGEIGRAVAADPARWSATVRANLDGSFNAIRAFHALLSRAPRRAKIVCFSGGGATKARARFSAYGAAKTAVVRLVETIAEEEKSAALDINAVAPGAIHTRLTDEVIARGLRQVDWQGRWQRTRLGGRLLILDASHNPEGAQVLDSNLARLRSETGRRPIVITGALGTARAGALLATVARHAGEIHLVVPKQARACSHEELELLLPADFRGRVVRSTVETLFPGPGVCTAGGPEDAIVVTGSIYVLGEVLARIEPGRGPEEGRLQDF